MRKICLFILVFVCFVAGCSKSGGEFADVPAVASSAVPRAVQQPDIIQKCLAQQFERRGLSYRVSERDARVMTRVLKDDSEAYEMSFLISGSDTLMYVVDYADGGWKLLSGDKRTQPVLAYSPNGKFSLDNGNPGEKIWFAQVADGLSALRSRESAPATATAFTQAVDPMWVDLAPATADYNWEDDGQWILESTRVQTTVSQVGPLTMTMWGQMDPWNNCCPTVQNSSSDYADAGCVAVSGAQMLYFLHYKWGVPATMYESGTCTGDISSYFFSFSNPTVAAWDKMEKKHEYGKLNILAYYSAVLIGYVGQNVNMKYGGDAEGGSGSDHVKLRDFFSRLGIQSSYKDYSSPTVFERLDAGVPVIVDAFGNKINDRYYSGHSWIIDGYQKKFRYTVLTYRWYSRYAIDEQPGDIDDDLLDTDTGTDPDPDGGGSPDPGPEEEPDNNGAALPGTGEITDNEYVDETYAADELSIVSILRDGGDAPDPKDPLYPTNQTREVVTSSVPDGLFWHMNWGGVNQRTGTSVGYDHWYGLNDDWDISDSNYIYKRKMLVITGHN